MLEAVGQRERHRRVVGPLPWLEVEGPATDHIDQCRLPVARGEFERRADRIADGEAEQRPDRAIDQCRIVAIDGVETQSQRHNPAAMPASGICAQVAASQITTPPAMSCGRKPPKRARPAAMAAKGQ
jgi:hypothetical protein